MSAPANIWAMPTAKVGAPPVRPTMVFSPTLAARSDICSGVTAKPRVLTLAVTAVTSPFMLIAKYSPGSIAQAAINAISPTTISVTMAP